MSLPLEQLAGERLLGRPLAHIIVADAEFRPVAGELPTPVCFTTKDLVSGEVRDYWADELSTMRKCPFPLGPDSLFLSFNLLAEFSVMLRLGWNLPELAIDLMAEFRRATNGCEHQLPNGDFAKLYSLLDALRYYGIREVDAAYKEKMQRLAVETIHWTPELKAELLAYNRQDVIDHELLFRAMAVKIDYPRALLRGHYCQAAAHIERRGLSCDSAYLEKFFTNRNRVMDRLIADIDREYRVFDGDRFKVNRFAEYLDRANLLRAWPQTKSGLPKTDKDTFRDFAQAFPEVKNLATLLSTRKHTAHKRLPVGTDGRNRFSLRPFWTKTGRNGARPSECLPSCPGWMRNFIVPPPGKALIQSDWEQQEYGIAAALSGDPKMLEAYRTGDPYLALAKEVGAIPENGTKETHHAQRNLFKQCGLGVLYGIGAGALGKRIGDIHKARELLEQHANTYPTFWAWRQAAIDHAFVQGYLDTAYGWRIYVTEHTKPTTIGNFPMQANGAEMMRIAAILAEEHGLQTVAIIHDAFLVECDLDETTSTGEALKEVMREASRLVLGGFELRSDLKVIPHPERYTTKDKQEFWNRVCALIDASATDGVQPHHPRLPG